MIELHRYFNHDMIKLFNIQLLLLCWRPTNNFPPPPPPPPAAATDRNPSLPPTTSFRFTFPCMHWWFFTFTVVFCVCFSVAVFHNARLSLPLPESMGGGGGEWQTVVFAPTNRNQQEQRTIILLLAFTRPPRSVVVPLTVLETNLCVFQRLKLQFDVRIELSWL